MKTKRLLILTLILLVILGTFASIPGFASIKTYIYNGKQYEYSVLNVDTLVSFPTIADAISSAKGTSLNLILLDDINETVSSSGSVETLVIDLNDKTLYGTNSSDSVIIFSTDAPKTLVIRNGTLSSNKSQYGACVYITAGISDITFKSVTFNSPNSGSVYIGTPNNTTTDTKYSYNSITFESCSINCHQKSSGIILKPAQFATATCTATFKSNQFVKDKCGALTLWEGFSEIIFQSGTNDFNQIIYKNKLNIKGGNFCGTFIHNSWPVTTDTSVISGGNFNEKHESCLADGCCYLDSTVSGYSYTVGTAVCTIGSKQYGSIQSAVNATTSSSDEIVLITDVTENISLSQAISHTVKINLKSYNWSYAATNSPVIDILGACTLEVYSDSDAFGQILGSGRCAGSLAYINDTDASIDFKNIELSTDNASIASNKGVCIYNKAGTVSLSGKAYIRKSNGRGAVYNSGTFNMTDNSGIISCVGYIAGGVINTGTMTMSGDSHISGCNASSCQGGGVYNTGTLTMKEDSFLYGCNAGTGKGGGIYNTGKLYMKGLACIMNCSASEGSAICNDNSSAVVVMSGESDICMCAGSCIAINSGSFTISEDTTVVYDSSNSKATQIQLKGGSLTVTGGTVTSSITKADGATVKVSGGWFSEKVKYPADGYVGTEALSSAPSKSAPYSVQPLTFYVCYKKEKLTMKGTNVLPSGSLFTRTGFTFKCWNTKEDGSGTNYDENKAASIANGTCFYPVWTVNKDVKRTLILMDPYKLNTTKTITINDDEYTITANSVNWYKYDHTITSWNTSTDGSGKSVPIGAKIYFGDTLTVTLYGQWTQNERMEYNANGTILTVDFVDPDKANPDFTFSTDKSYIRLTSNGFQRDGYSFKCWNTAADGSGNSYFEGSLYFPKSSGNNVLYAQWKSKDSSSYFSIGGDDTKQETDDSQTVVDFSGGGEGTGGGTSSGQSSEYNTIVYHDGYNADSSTSTIKSKTYDTDTMVMYCYFSRSGYSFTGWNTQLNGSGTTYKAGSTINFTSDGQTIDLYAQWKSKSGSSSGDGSDDDDSDSGKSGSGDDSSGKSSKSKEERIKEIEEEQKKNKTYSSTGGAITISDNGTTYQEPEEGFDDVYSGKSYSDAVSWALKYGITNGKYNTYDANGNLVVHFGTNEICTRAQIVSFIWRALGEPEPKSDTCPFVDVKESSYYYEAVIWAVENGITLGKDDTHFQPNGKCTRANAVAFLWRAFGKPASSASVPFTDTKKNSYYSTAVAWAYENGITLGKTATTFAPSSGCTRAQIVTFLYRCYNAEMFTMEE